MKSPGIDVRPLTNMADTPSFNEVFFDDVRVPKKDLLGELNRGWYVGHDDARLRALRHHQRRQPAARRAGTRRVRAQRPAHGRAAGRAVRHELADRAIEAEVLIMLSYRIVSMQAKGIVPNQEASITKLFGSELAQRIARTGVKIAGAYGMLTEGSPRAPMDGRLDALYRIAVGSTIAGGTSEIQRGVIAQRGLGLPHDRRRRIRPHP